MGGVEAQLEDEQYCRVKEWEVSGVNWRCRHGRVTGEVAFE